MRSTDPFGEAMTVQMKALAVERFYSSINIPREMLQLSPDNFAVRVEDIMESMTKQIVLMLRLPMDVLQRDEEVTRFPASWWDSTKWALRKWVPWSMKVRFRVVRVTEMLLYPDVQVPAKSAEYIRIAYTSSISGTEALSRARHQSERSRFLKENERRHGPLSRS